MSIKISEYNSTETLLDANLIFIGQKEDLSGYNFINIGIRSDVNSAVNGLELFFSNVSDSEFTNTVKYTYHGLENREYTIPINFKYFYIKYTNGNTNQTMFHLNVTYKIVNDREQIVSLNKANIDTFNRLRVSQLNTLTETNQIYNKNYLREDEYTSGSGLVSYNVNESMNTLSVTGVGRVVRQTRLYCHYQPGKSLLALLTGIINNNENGLATASRIGYFDDNNGLFFEYSNRTMYVVLRTYTTGSPVDTKIAQTDWNTDIMNGNGPSRLNIDFTKYLIFTINFSWLGAGIVEMGLYYSGIHYIVHTFKNIDITSPYMVTPHLPGRFEIVSTGDNGSLKQACISINSESAQEIIGQTYSIGTVAERSVNNTEDYIMSIKLQSNTRRNVILKTISLMCTTKGNVEYKIYLVLSPSSSPITDINANNGFVTVNSNSVVEYNITGTQFNSANSIILYQGYFSTLVNIDRRQLSERNDPIYLTSGIDGTKSDYLVITGRNITGTNNESISCTLNWIEI